MRVERSLPIFLILTLLSCSPKQTSIIYSDQYDKTADKTSVMIFPYGELKVPGKWTKIRENTVGGQYFFIGQDSTQIAIAMQPWDKYEFSYKNPAVTPENFARKFYEWDAPYLSKQTNGNAEVVKENKEKNYLIWSLSGAQRRDYFLFGLKGKTAYNLYVNSDTWDDEKKVSFLEGLFEK